MKRRMAAGLAGSVVLAAATLAVAPANAAPAAPPPVQHATSQLGAMQRDLGLTLRQATDRLGQEATASRADRDLRGALGDSFGGSHFDAKLGKLVVGVPDRALFGAVRAAGADARLVAFTAKQLGSAAQGLNAHLDQLPKSVTGFYVDPASDAVVLTTAPGTARQAGEFVQSSGVDAKTVRVVESPESPRPLADVVGGNAYTIGSSARCSVGFAVNDGFISAGHCGKAGAKTTEPNGTFDASSFPHNDYSHIKVAQGETPRPLVNNYQGGTVGVAGSAEAPVGASVCRSGSTSGWHCGTVQAVNQTVQYSDGPVSGLSRTNVCAEPGDSGGSFLAGDQAQGVTSGGSGDCSAGGTTYFQPVNEILGAYGLQLQRSAVVPPAG